MSPKGWHSRGYLPHFDSQEIVQFVTYRLADSLPREALDRIRLASRPESLRDELLDKGWGNCWLRQPEIAASIEQSFYSFDGGRYLLHAWTIMPNHVHVLLTPMPGMALGTIIGSWKRFTARHANRLLGRSGTFWQDDYWDRFIRNQQHFEAAVSYIDQNPVKAGLVSEPPAWPWGSARFAGSAQLQWRLPIGPAKGS